MDQNSEFFIEKLELCKTLMVHHLHKMSVGNFSHKFSICWHAVKRNITTTKSKTSKKAPAKIEKEQKTEGKTEEKAKGMTENEKQNEEKEGEKDVDME